MPPVPRGPDVFVWTTCEPHLSCSVATMFPDPMFPSCCLTTYLLYVCVLSLCVCYLETLSVFSHVSHVLLVCDPFGVQSTRVLTWVMAVLPMYVTVTPWTDCVCWLRYLNPAFCVLAGHFHLVLRVHAMCVLLPMCHCVSVLCALFMRVLPAWSKS